MFFTQQRLKSARLTLLAFLVPGWRIDASENDPYDISRCTFLFIHKRILWRLRCTIYIQRTLIKTLYLSHVDHQGSLYRSMVVILISLYLHKAHLKGPSEWNTLMEVGNQRSILKWFLECYTVLYVIMRHMIIIVAIVIMIKV